MSLHRHHTYTPRQSALGLAAWLGVTFAAAAVGAMGAASAPEFYASLRDRPPWAPPGWLFAPVWMLLYTMMAMAAWRIWRHGGWRRQRGALTLYVAQLGLNALWSWLFFAWRLGMWASVDIALLCGLVAAMIAVFSQRSRTAPWLLGPYLLWLAYAGALCVRLWRTNAAVLG
jgi:tryptophan-rich sensory protein